MCGRGKPARNNRRFALCFAIRLRVTGLVLTPSSSVRAETAHHITQAGTLDRGHSGPSHGKVMGAVLQYFRSDALTILSKTGGPLRPFQG